MVRRLRCPRLASFGLCAVLPFDCRFGCAQSFAYMGIGWRDFYCKTGAALCRSTMITDAECRTPMSIASRIALTSCASRSAERGVPQKPPGKDRYGISCLRLPVVKRHRAKWRLQTRPPAAISSPSKPGAICGILCGSLHYLAVRDGGSGAPGWFFPVGQRRRRVAIACAVARFPGRASSHCCSSQSRQHGVQNVRSRHPPIPENQRPEARLGDRGRHGNLTANGSRRAVPPLGAGRNIELRGDPLHRRPPDRRAAVPDCRVDSAQGPGAQARREDLICARQGDSRPRGGLPSRLP